MLRFEHFAMFGCGECLKQKPFWRLCLTFSKVYLDCLFQFISMMMIQSKWLSNRVSSFSHPTDIFRCQNIVCFERIHTRRECWSWYWYLITKMARLREFCIAPFELSKSIWLWDTTPIESPSSILLVERGKKEIWML